MALKDLFSFLFQRSSGEERVAQYVIREHDRGRPLAEILEDRYVLNRLQSPQQRARLLDRPEIIQAVGGDMAEAAKAAVTAPRRVLAASPRTARSRTSSATATSSSRPAPNGSRLYPHRRRAGRESRRVHAGGGRPRRRPLGRRRAARGRLSRSRSTRTATCVGHGCPATSRSWPRSGRAPTSTPTSPSGGRRRRRARRRRRHDVRRSNELEPPAAHARRRDLSAEEERGCGEPRALRGGPGLPGAFVELHHEQGPRLARRARRSTSSPGALRPQARRLARARGPRRQGGHDADGRPLGRSGRRAAAEILGIRDVAAAIERRRGDVGTPRSSRAAPTSFPAACASS